MRKAGRLICAMLMVALICSAVSTGALAGLHHRIPCDLSLEGGACELPSGGDGDLEKIDKVYREIVTFTLRFIMTFRLRP